MEQQPDYRIYATLLDSYQNFLDSEKTWERYWGDSETPPCTMEDFRARQYRELIDGINRKRKPSEAADRGTAFNEIVDALNTRRPSERCNLERITDAAGVPVGVKATMKEERPEGWPEFRFPLDTCRRWAEKYRDGVPQLLVSSVFSATQGKVELYGYVDYLMPDSIHDIKTTSRYSAGKYRTHSQHLVYPYCLWAGGSDIRRFDYDVLTFKKKGEPDEEFQETYVFEPDRDIPILRDRLDQLILFLEANRGEITDGKIFCQPNTDGFGA